MHAQSARRETPSPRELKALNRFAHVVLIDAIDQYNQTIGTGGQADKYRREIDPDGRAPYEVARRFERWEGVGADAAERARDSLIACIREFRDDAMDPGLFDNDGEPAESCEPRAVVCEGSMYAVYPDEERPGRVSLAVVPTKAIIDLHDRGRLWDDDEPEGEPSPPPEPTPSRRPSPTESPNVRGIIDTLLGEAIGLDADEIRDRLLFVGRYQWVHEIINRMGTAWLDRGAPLAELAPPVDPETLKGDEHWRLDVLIEEHGIEEVWDRLYLRGRYRPVEE